MPMKRLMVPLVLLAFLGGLTPALRAQSPCCEGRQCPAKADACYTKELLDILQTTHSVDAFVVTLNLLVDTDVEPRTAIPLIVRQAERLGIFADSLQDDQEDEDQPSALVIQVLGKLKDRMHPARPVPVGAAVGSASGGCCGSCDDCCRDKCKTEDTTEFRTPVVPPLREGPASACSCPPEDAEVLRALPKLCHVPGLCDECRDKVEIVTEQIVNRVDEPRFYPMIGMAQVHHCHWKCTVYYNETIEGSYPCCYQITQPHVAVVYIDKDHLHLYQPEEKSTPNAIFFDFGFSR